ncbi:hypothetical protein DFH07DRAFT_767673 [Mycena maculata]|uniref:Uncharacterized protein n=1 Tax=Mycena maculata TaxID=230809 RepID=A0AAD7JZM9_9AGAR|nr:hypothetical protein DFH07DRAFT_767673 [Mycena maculata]
MSVDTGVCDKFSADGGGHGVFSAGADSGAFGGSTGAGGLSTNPTGTFGTSTGGFGATGGFGGASTNATGFNGGLGAVLRPQMGWGGEPVPRVDRDGVPTPDDHRPILKGDKCRERVPSFTSWKPPEHYQA